MTKIAKIIATGAGVGFLPLPTGTAMSLVTAGVFDGMMMVAWGGYFWLYFFLVAVASIIGGWWATNIYLASIYRGNTTNRGRKNPDPSEVVIDEWAGQWLALLPLVFYKDTISHQQLVIITIIGFFLFRLLDIWKPFFIGVPDRLNKVSKNLSFQHRGWYVMADDIYAGLVVAVVVAAVGWWYVA